MKPFSNCIFLLLALVLSGPLMAQTKTYEERLADMEAEELKIEAYIEAHIGQPIPRELIDQLVADLHQEAAEHGHGEAELSEAEQEALAQAVKANYWRTRYFTENPDAQDVYEAAWVTDCDNGNFESGFQGWDLASNWGNNGYMSGGSGFIPSSWVNFLVPEVPNFNTDNFNIMSPGTDQIAPITQTNTLAGFSGVQSMRINGPTPLANPYGNSCAPTRGINRLSRTITLPTADAEIGYYFALVMEFPNHTNSNPFFVARVLDANGVELDRDDRDSDPNDPFFISQPAQTIGGCLVEQTVYQDWACGILKANGKAGDQVTLEFYMADCGQGAHFGYAYVDDVCEVCEVDTCNYLGNIELNALDSCVGETFQVCGSFDLAAQNCNTASVNSITLSVIQGGVVTALTVTPTIDLVNGTFCFDLDRNDFPSPNGSYDFRVDIAFGLNGGVHIESDVHTRPGVENDVDLDCCDCEVVALNPQFSIPGLCQTVNFDATLQTSGPDCQAVTTTWDFGDGTTASLTGPNNFSTQHIYSAPGWYVVCATVAVGKDNAPLCTDTLTECINVFVPDTLTIDTCEFFVVEQCLTEFFLDSASACEDCDADTANGTQSEWFDEIGQIVPLGIVGMQPDEDGSYYRYYYDANGCLVCVKIVHLSVAPGPQIDTCTGVINVNCMVSAGYPFDNVGFPCEQCSFPPHHGQFGPWRDEQGNIVDPAAFFWPGMQPGKFYQNRFMGGCIVCVREIDVQFNSYVFGGSFNIAPWCPCFPADYWTLMGYANSLASLPCSVDPSGMYITPTNVPPPGLALTQFVQPGDVYNLCAGTTYKIVPAGKPCCTIYLSPYCFGKQALGTDDPTEAAGLIKVMPNPASGEFWIETEGAMPENTTVHIFGVNGQLVATRHVNSQGGNRLHFITTDWASGLYTVQFESQGAIIHTQKVMVAQ